MGSKFLSGIPWPKKLAVPNLNEKDLNIFVFVCFFLQYHLEKCTSLPKEQWGINSQRMVNTFYCSLCH